MKPTRIRIGPVPRCSVPVSPCRLCQKLLARSEARGREIKRLRNRIETLKRDNARLREQLSEAQRASKRQAAPFSKGLPKADPKRPGRKSGEQYGVKARRAIPDHVDETHQVWPESSCPHCGGEVELERVVPQYQEDIPPVTPFVRRFDVVIGRCVRCKRTLRGRHPLQTSDALGAAGVSIGPRALALAADLNKRIGTPFGKVSLVLYTAFSLSVSRGGLYLALERVARTLAPTYDALVGQTQEAPMVAVDETGWKVGGQLHWLWAFVTPTTTVYRIMDGRGYDEACQILAPGFSGTLLRDGWAPYRCFEHAVHQSCLAHLIRRCRENLEMAQRGAARLPHALLRLLLHALELRDHWLEQPPTPLGRAIHVGRLEAAMGRLLAWKPSVESNRKLVKHLRNERGALFTFLREPAVPATNWWGEQAIRPAVVTRKVWGGNRTAAGAITQQVIASVIRTCTQQHVDPGPLIERLLRSPVPSVAPLPSLVSGP